MNSPNCEWGSVVLELQRASSLPHPCQVQLEGSSTVGGWSRGQGAPIPLSSASRLTVSQEESQAASISHPLHLQVQETKCLASAAKRLGVPLLHPEPACRTESLFWSLVKILSLSLSFNDLIITCLTVGLFVFSLLGVHWSSICRIVSFIRFGGFQLLFLQIFF